MKPSKTNFPKYAVSSTHSVPSTRNSFKRFHEQPTQKLTTPFAKTQHLFLKRPKKPKPTHNFNQTQTILRKKKNITCINLGMDDEYQRTQPLPKGYPKGYFPKRMKLKEFLTCRNTQPVLNATFYQKPTLLKRQRHQSVVSMIEKYTLFGRDRQKENIENFQKKMLNSLAKKEDCEKFMSRNFPSQIRFVSYCKPESKSEIPSPKHQKVQRETCSEKSTHKWRSLAQKFKNGKLPLSQSTLKNKNPPAVLPKCHKKLTRKPSRQNATFDSILASLTNLQNPQQQKQNIASNEQSPQKQYLQATQKYEASIFKKENFKFSRLTKSKDSGWGQTEKFCGRWESSKSKLGRLLSRERGIKGENKPILTPWQSVASEKQIDLATA